MGVCEITEVLRPLETSIIRVKRENEKSHRGTIETIGMANSYAGINIEGKLARTFGYDFLFSLFGGNWEIWSQWRGEVMRLA